jgi:hypothetical protein
MPYLVVKRVASFLIEYPDVDLQPIGNIAPCLIDGLQGPDHSEFHLRKRPIREHLRLLAAGVGVSLNPAAHRLRALAASLGCPLKRYS